MSELYAALLRTITHWQYELNKLVSGSLKDLDSPEAMTAAFTVIGIAFVYGVIHAVGPGHGKSLVGLYFLREGGSYRQALKMGYLIAAVHALSALTLTMVIYYLIDTLFSKSFREFSGYSMIASAVLIILVGCYLVYESWSHRNAKEETKLSNRSGYAVAFSAGIVPCPGVMTITLFALSMGHVALGVVSALVMSVGMGLTISLAGIASVAVQKKGKRFLGGYGWLLQLASALLVIALGTLLLLANLQPASPFGR
ncbi:MAG: high frequency lysogenization protein HflD [Sulfurovum sp.]|nr:high frequency lysogenization protein HflD [Sulfurovum sp.]